VSHHEVLFYLDAAANYRPASLTMTRWSVRVCMSRATGRSPTRRSSSSTERGPLDSFRVCSLLSRSPCRPVRPTWLRPIDPRPACSARCPIHADDLWPSWTATRLLQSSSPTASGRISRCLPQRFARVRLPPWGCGNALPWVEWWPRSTKRYNAKIGHRNQPADDIEGMYPHAAERPGVGPTFARSAS